MLKNIEKGGEDEVIRYSQQFDNHTSNIVSINNNQSTNFEIKRKLVLLCN